MQAASTPRALAAAWVLDATAALEYGDAAARSSRAPGDVDRDVEIVIDDAKPSSVPRPRAAGRRSARRERKAPIGNNEAEALLREIAEKFERLGDLDLYALLGVAPDAEASDIKRAYHQAAKTLPPRRPGAFRPRRRDAREGEQGLRRDRQGARRALRSASDAATTTPSVRTRDTDLDADRLAQAETLYRKAEILLRQGNFKGALEFLQPAVDLWPEECTYQSALGWALYKKPPSEPEAALEHLERALRIDPNDAETEFRLGIVRRSLGRAE